MENWNSVCNSFYLVSGIYCWHAVCGAVPDGRVGICKVPQWASPYYFSGSNAPFLSKIELWERNGSEKLIQLCFYGYDLQQATSWQQPAINSAPKYIQKTQSFRKIQDIFENGNSDD